MVVTLYGQTALVLQLAGLTVFTQELEHVQTLPQVMVEKHASNKDLVQQ